MGNASRAEQYRAKAAECDRMAAAMSEGETQAQMKAIAQQWRQLANQIEIIEGKAEK